MSPRVTRRALLAGGLTLSATGWLGTTACTTTSQPEAPIPTPPTAPSSNARSPSDGGPGARVLLAYFSRAGENYYYGGRRDLEVGNTEVLAGMIAELIDCDMHRIEAADPYPDDYDATVQRNVTEQDEDARPGIANPLTSIAAYDTVLLGSPIWNVRAPMIMTTLTEAHDFAGKTVLPFVTYAVSGLGSVQRDYTRSCRGAQIGEGLAVRGEEVNQSHADVEDWLQTAGLLRR
ncbi:MAG TPA: flavodoxin [Propionibacteriaceae bacterium]|nr:flavodoxin [Propionibacteriaceae bacterium]